MSNDFYKTFRVSVRPPRVVCLIDSKDENWHPKVLTALESFSRTWGGAGFIIVPTDGKIISIFFWKILLAYDPDYIWISYKTDDDYELGLRISDKLTDELKLRLAPFHYDGSHLIESDKQKGLMQNLIIKGGTFPNFKAKYPFTDITTILPNCEHSNKITEISNLQGIMQVWTTASIGAVSPRYKNELEEIGVESVSFDYSENQSKLFDIVVKGVQRDLTDEDTVFPFAFSKSKLGFYRSFEFADWKEATLVIIGDSLEDFCLYFCLSRMRTKVAWLLTSWLPSNIEEHEGIRIYENNPLSCFTRSLRDIERENQQNAATHFMSASLPLDEVEKIRDLFRRFENINVGNGLVISEEENDIALSNEENLSKSVEFLLSFPTKLLEQGNFDKIVSRHFVGFNMAGFFETPKPKNFSKISVNHHWINEFSIVNEQFPRHPSLGKEIVREPMIFHSHARIGKDSIAFVDPKSGYITEDIDSWLRKPQIRLLNAFQIFDLLFQKIGYNSEISDKGRFAEATLLKFGGLNAFANFFHANKGEVLNRFTFDGNRNFQDEGIFLKSDRRWYLNFNTFRSILNNDNVTAKVIYLLLKVEILHRGLVLKCQLCRNTDWYSISEISNEFQCKRCNLKQIYQKFHALNQLEPSWYYKLDEVVYQAMTHNFIVPVMTLNYLSNNAKIFDYCPELELRNNLTNQQMLEIDICCIQDGKLTIGEAKIADCLANSKREENAAITKYFELSEKMGASQIVFATASVNWQEKTRERIVKRFSDSLTQTILLTKKDLFNEL